jgi:hypothetical protein
MQRGQHPLGIFPRQFGYPLSFRGQVCGTQSSLPCVSSMGLNAWRPPSLQRVLVSPVPRHPWYYEAPTTSRRACPSAYGFASGFHMSWWFVFAYALPMLAKSTIGPGALLAGAPGRLPHVDTSGSSQVSWWPIPYLCPAPRPRPNRKGLTVAASRCCPHTQHGEGFGAHMISRLTTGLQYPLSTLHE